MVLILNYFFILSFVATSPKMVRLLYDINYIMSFSYLLFNVTL